jgi:hypothetical protein
MTSHSKITHFNWECTGRLTRINKTQNVEIDSPASSGGQGKYTKHVGVPWPSLEGIQQIFNGGFVSVRKQNFENEINENKKDVINAEPYTF